MYFFNVFHYKNCFNIIEICKLRMALDKFLLTQWNSLSEDLKRSHTRDIRHAKYRSQARTLYFSSIAPFSPKQLRRNVRSQKGPPFEKTSAAACPLLDERVSPRTSRVCDRRNERFGDGSRRRVTQRTFLLFPLPPLCPSLPRNTQYRHPCAGYLSPNRCCIPKKPRSHCATNRKSSVGFWLAASRRRSCSFRENFHRRVKYTRVKPPFLIGLDWPWGSVTEDHRVLDAPFALLLASPTKSVNCQWTLIGDIWSLVIFEVCEVLSW